LSDCVFIAGATLSIDYECERLANSCEYSKELPDFIYGWNFLKHPSRHHF